MKRVERERLTERVKRAARTLGADLVGIAPVERFRNAPLRMSPQGLLPSARCAVVMAIHHLDAAVELGGEPSPQDIGPYATQYTMNARLDDLSFGLARVLEDAGWRALPIAVSNLWRYHGTKKGTGTFSPGGEKEPVPGLPDFAPDLAHRYAAVAAGLGEIGWSNLTLTPEFGPRARFVTVLTDAPLVPTPMYSGPRLCDRCMECVKHCPTDAFRKELRGHATIEIGGRAFTFPETNKWRCSWGENFDLDLSLPIPDRVDESVALAALEKHGMRGGEMGSCLRFCMVPRLRRSDPAYSRAPRRRKTPLVKSPAKLLALVRRALKAIPVDVLAVGRASDFRGDFSVHPEYHLPGAASVISIGMSPPKGGEASATVATTFNRLLDYARFEAARALDLAGYSAVTRTNIADNLVAQRLGVYRSGVQFATVLTSAKLPKTVVRARRAATRPTARSVRALARSLGADLVGFFDVARFERFRAQIERLGLLPTGRDAVVDRGGVYGPWVPQIRREATRLLSPADHLPGARSVIVLGLHFPDAALDTAKTTPAGTTGPFAFVQYETLFLLRDMGYCLAKALERAGFRATVADDLTGLASWVRNSRGLLPDMRSNADAALLAGLAHVGLHEHPLTERYGVRQRFIAVVTDLALTSDPLPAFKRACDTCDRRCIAACPTHAIGRNRRALTLEGRRFPLPAIDAFACDWAKRYALSGPEGAAFWGVESDRPLPKERSVESLAAAVGAVRWGVQKRHVNVAEECLRVCPAARDARRARHNPIDSYAPDG